MAGTMESLKLEETSACAREAVREEIVLPVLAREGGTVVEVLRDTGSGFSLHFYEDVDAYRASLKSGEHASPKRNAQTEKAQHGLWLFGPERVENPAAVYRALSDSLELGAAYRISTATMAGDDPRGVAFDALGFDALPAARLVTSPVPVFEDTLRKQLRVRGDAVDMEGAVVGRLCAAANTPCAAVKCISDFAKAGDRETLHRNLKQASGALSAVLCERLGIQ